MYNFSVLLVSTKFMFGDDNLFFIYLILTVNLRHIYCNERLFDVVQHVNWQLGQTCWIKFRMFDSFEYLNLYQARICLNLVFILAFGFVFEI